MNAALPLSMLEVRPIRIPVYRNERIRSFGLWFSDNQNEIERYYNELKPFCEEGTEPLVDFFEFAAIQHEREELKAMSERIPHGVSL
jgi:hypothetical protein